MEGLALDAEPAANFDMVYPLESAVFTGSVERWVGQYAKGGQATLTARGVENGKAFQMRTVAALPAESAEHPQLPRTWARARVDALLEKIDREGEDRASIDEIKKSGLRGRGGAGR